MDLSPTNELLGEHLKFHRRKMAVETKSMLDATVPHNPKTDRVDVAKGLILVILQDLLSL
jgi:hypothetical protein